ncbi:MAG: hypothetical protein GQ574_07310 [Crocinitomix sp.]|nr:hypothetical protein [Crocinitomix sp.]
MNNTIASTVNSIDDYIRKNKWFDFHLWRYDGRNLIIAGSSDLTYYHKLEIIFTDVFFASTFFEGWHSDTDKAVIELPDPEFNKELNIKFEIEQGYQVFIIRTEDYKNDIYIAAKEIGFNTDTVYYYYRENLKDNERLA